METQPVRIQQFSRWFAQPRVRAFGIAIVVLAILAVLQVNHLKRDKAMCELLTGCHLQNEEIQRMQVAFSSAGMSEFQIRDHSVFVPTMEHSEYMKVASDAGALPASLTDHDAQADGSNPFLSRSQQKSIELTRKKQKVRHLVKQLPFVDQVEFEMDRSQSNNVFNPQTQKAVVSIRSKDDVVMTDRDVDTVRQMISGAVADLHAKDIVVIDIKNGLSYQNLNDKTTERQLRAQRVKFSQQQFYKSRVVEALSGYDGVKIRVDVTIREGVIRQEKVAMVPQTTLAQNPVDAQLPSPGANGVVSIEIEEPKPPVQLVSHVVKTPTLEKQVSVVVDVSEAAVFSVMGRPEANMKSAESRKLSIKQQTQKKFEQVRRDIVARVKGVLPPTENLADSSQVVVNLIASTPIAVVDTRWSWIEQQFNSHWPSVLVVAIGLLLLTMVTRHGVVEETGPVVTHRSGDVLSINGAEGDSANGAQVANAVDPEIRLSQMIEEDPDAAAKIIETWIRDAA